MVSDITPIQQSIKLIKETLQKIPQNIILSDHIGMIRPVKSSDLPAIVISVKNIKELSPGIGNFIGIQREDTEIFQELKGSRIRGVFK
jgi:histidinol phosphatase-like PHP family hydrolase